MVMYIYIESEIFWGKNRLFMLVIAACMMELCKNIFFENLGAPTIYATMKRHYCTASVIFWKNFRVFIFKTVSCKLDDRQQEQQQ